MQIYLDTNILVQLATKDDEKALEDAVQFISKQPKNSVTLAEAVLVEACFVLEYHDYKMSRLDICSFLQTVYNFSQIVADKRLEKAIVLYGKHSKLDFVDCILLEKPLENQLYTYDKNLQKAINARK